MDSYYSSTPSYYYQPSCLANYSYPIQSMPTQYYPMTPSPPAQQYFCFNSSTTNTSTPSPSTLELIPPNGRRRRQRTVFSKEQVDILDEIFLKNPYPDILLREELSDKLDVSESRIQVWFKNRRSRCRTMKKTKN